MAVENDKIKDLFSSKLGNFEPEVPASVWGGLDQLLSQQPPQGPDPTSSSQAADPSSSSSASSSSTASSSSSTASAAAGKASIIKSIAVAVGLVAAVATGVLLIPDKEVPPATEPLVVTQEVQPPLEEEPMDTIIETPTVKLIAKANAVISSVEKIEEQAKEIKSEKEETAREEKKEPVAEEIPEIQQGALTEVFSKPSRKRVSLGLISSAGLFSDNINERGGGLLFSREARSDVFKTALAQENSQFELEHKQPISFGLIISKPLTAHLSLETGVVYTYLSSKITSKSMFNINESQSFNYLGIPLSLNYTFYELGKTRFYFSIGGMVQKDIYGKYISDMNFSIQDMSDKTIANQIFYTEPYYIKNTIKQSNPQFSARTTLGITYPLYKKLYLYGTIGGAYYFDAGNAYRTIYSDKKTQLDLNLGVKIDF